MNTTLKSEADSDMNVIQYECMHLDASDCIVNMLLKVYI